MIRSRMARHGGGRSILQMTSNGTLVATMLYGFLSYPWRYSGFGQSPVLELTALAHEPREVSGVDLIHCPAV